MQRHGEVAVAGHVDIGGLHGRIDPLFLAIEEDLVTAAEAFDKCLVARRRETDHAFSRLSIFLDELGKPEAGL